MISNLALLVAVLFAGIALSSCFLPLLGLFHQQTVVTWEVKLSWCFPLDSGETSGVIMLVSVYALLRYIQ